jgi:hypothetical protein
MPFDHRRGRRLWGGALVLAVCLAAPWPGLAQRRRAPRGAGRGAPAAKGRRAPQPAVRPQWRAALARVTAESMRGHLSFIASDALEGRANPSRGLDLAAEYIAAQFRRAGLEPAGDDGYFQTAKWELTGRDSAGVELRLASGAGAPLVVAPELLSLGYRFSGLQLWTPEGELTLDGAGTLKVGETGLDEFTRERVAGRVVFAEFSEVPRDDRARALQFLQARQRFLARAHALGAPLVVFVERTLPRRRPSPPPRLSDPEAPARTSPLGPEPTAPLVTAYGPEVARFYDALPMGAGEARVTFRAPAPPRTPVRLRNVAGILRGSDPRLRDTYVMVSAHYDHVGLRAECAAGADCVNNGANDNGSGTTAVIELAAALSKLEVKPKRSIIFITFCGEELGLWGSRYYGRHPLVPLAQTVAQVNMEQIGRTDDSEGPRVGAAVVTGFDYSGVGATLARAGEEAGVSVTKHPTKSDAYFSRSDNQALADLGVPAHTLGVAFEFPDYHAPGDHWEKIDYANMERVARAVGLGLLMLADAAEAPRWDATNPRAARYAEAWKKLHGQ